MLTEAEATQELRDSGLAMLHLHEAMVKLDIDVGRVYNQLGLSTERLVEQLSDRKLRTRHDAVAAFWLAVENVSGDKDIGLHLGEKAPLYRGQVLEYLFLSSLTFGEGLKRALKYQRLFSDAAQGELGIEGDQAWLAFDVVTHAVETPRHLAEWLACVFIRFYRFVTNRGFTPSRITFRHSQPASMAEHDRILRCPIDFDRGSNRIYFDAALLEVKSPHAEPELLRLHEQVASKQLHQLEKQDVVGKVRSAIAEVLEEGGANLEGVSARLDYRPRELRHTLSEAGTNFNQILNEYRRNLARRLLLETEESIENVVYLTGFSEPSTFYRAFKRWFEDTPAGFRGKYKDHNKG